jgi:hypothetical protein
MAISRMEEALAWLIRLELDQARLVWMRAEGQYWKPISTRSGRPGPPPGVGGSMPFTS